jgi:tetratricopeptide (TPR) repeat protein
MPIASRKGSSTGFGWKMAPMALHKLMRYLGFVPDMEPVFVDTYVPNNFFRYAMRYKRVAKRGVTAGDFANVMDWRDIPPMANADLNNAANGTGHSGEQWGGELNGAESFDLEELTALARLDIEQGRVEQGLGKLKSILANPSAPAPALSMAARLYAQLGLFERAETLFVKYVSMVPGALEEQFQLGMVRLDKGDSAGALETWEALLKQQPTFPPALFYCAVVQNKLGKIADARRNVDVLLQTAPTDNLYYGRGKELLQAMGRDVMQQSAVVSQAYHDK